MIACIGNSVVRNCKRRTALLETRNSLAPRLRRRKFATNGGAVMIALVAGEDLVALRDQIVRGARGQRLDRQAGIGRALGRKDAAVADEQIGDVVGAAELIHDRPARVGAHAAGADQVRVARLLHDLRRAGGPHHLPRSFPWRP